MLSCKTAFELGLSGLEHFDPSELSEALSSGPQLPGQGPSRAAFLPAAVIFTAGTFTALL